MALNSRVPWRESEENNYEWDAYTLFTLSPGESPPVFDIENALNSNSSFSSDSNTSFSVESDSSSSFASNSSSSAASSEVQPIHHDRPHDRPRSFGEIFRFSCNYVRDKMQGSNMQFEAQRNRLPSLYEVLARKTAAPVDLYCFYIYMRDQQRSVDYLDFWLDVAQHTSLCRHFVRELRRSILVETPDLEKTNSKRSSYMLDHMSEMNDPAGPSTDLNDEEKIKDQNLSAYLRENTGASNHSPQSSLGSQPSGLRASGDRAFPGGERPPRPSFMSRNSPTRTDSNSPAHTVARADIRASAEKILFTYILPGSEREVVLPQGIVQAITTAIEEEGRDDPELFDTAKDYTFQAMERDAFPGFLRSKALGNLVPPSLFLRVVFGILAMFAGFWAGFIFIFLDFPKHTRCWVILPFTIGVYLLASQQYSIDPILALVGYSEYTFFNFSRVREPYVRKLLNKRALMVLLVTIAVGVCVIVLFVFVPGVRL